MLSVAFFISIFSSVVWVFYAIAHNTNGELNHFAITAALIVLPIFILWVIFGYIYQYISASVLNKNMYSLFKQIRKNQETSEAVARVLLESRDTLKDNLFLSKFDIFIADINELLAEILVRGKLLSEEQVDKLWVKVKNGGNWTFGKAIIELSLAQQNLNNQLLQKALSDGVLGGTILEFCSHYQSLISTLEKHDKERVFLNMVETGVLGKVFSLFANPADSIRQNRDLTLAHQQMNDLEEKEEILPLPETYRPTGKYEEDIPEKSSRTDTLSESAKRLFINTFKRKEAPNDQISVNEIEPKDPLSLAFAKSFGHNQEDQQEKEAPHFEPSFTSPLENDTLVLSDEIRVSENVSQEETMPDIHITNETQEPPLVVSPDITAGFSSVQEKLADMKKGWEDAKEKDISIQKGTTDGGMPEPKVSNDSNFSYPFGGWMNADNYK